MPTQPSKPSPAEQVPPQTAASRTLVFGCGYLGIRVAKNALFSGNSVWATTRKDDKAAELCRLGIEAVVADWTDSRTLRSLPTVDRVLIAVSYDRSSGHDRYESQVGGLDNLLEVLPAETKICYISTTGVYHQKDGQWVDEDTAVDPEREGGRVHLQAEKLLQQRRSSDSITILRLAGIYGPDRVPRAADVQAGRPIASLPDGYLNLIHVEDAAAVVAASWSTARRPLYVVSDDCPVRREEFYSEVARQCGCSPPTFAPPGDGASDRLRSTSNKRICNRRMKADLLGQLSYPSYREGLANVLQAS